MVGRETVVEEDEPDETGGAACRREAPPCLAGSTTSRPGGGWRVDVGRGYIADIGLPAGLLLFRTDPAVVLVAPLLPLPLLLFGAPVPVPAPMGLVGSLTGSRLGDVFRDVGAVSASFWANSSPSAAGPAGLRRDLARLSEVDDADMVATRRSSICTGDCCL